MADTVVTLRINADGSAAISTVKQLADQTEQSGKRMQSQFSAVRGGVQSISEQLRQARDYLIGFAGIELGKELIAGVVEANTKLSGFRYGLEAATGSASGAREELQWVREESDRLGISVEDSAATFVRLTAATKGTRLEGQATRDVFTGVAEAARTLHLSAAETQQALTALDQMMSKGTVQSQELKLQLGNVLPGAAKIAADALGVTEKQFGEMMDKGQILAEDFLPKLAARLHELYGGTAVEAANSPAAELERLKNAAFELKAAIGDAGFMAALASGASALTGALTTLVQSGALDVIVRGLIAIAAGTAAAWAVGAMRAWITNLLLARVAIEGAATAQYGLNLAMGLNPVGLVVTALAALYEAYRYLSAQEEQHRAQLEAVSRETETATTTTAALVEQLEAADTSGFGKVSVAIRTYKDDLEKLDAAQKALAQTSAQLADAQARVERSMGGYGEAAAYASLDAGRAQEDASRLTDEYIRQKAEVERLSEAMHGLETYLQTVGTQFGRSAQFADIMTDALDRMHAAAQVGDLGGLFEAVFNAFAKGGQAAADADKKASDSLVALTDLNAKFTKSLETRGKTETQIAKAAIERAVADAEAAHKTDEQIASIRTQGEALLKSAAALDALKVHHKKAADSAGELARAEKGLDDMLDTLRGTTSAADKAQSDYAKGLRELQARAEAAAIAGGDVDEIIKRWREGEELLRQNLDKTNAELLKRNQITSGNKDLVEQLKQQRDRLAGVTTAQQRYNEGVREANEEAEKANQLGIDADTIAAGLEDRLKKLAEIRDNEDVLSIVDQFGSQSEFDRLVANIGRVEDALAKATDPNSIKKLQTELGNLRQATLVYATSAIGQGIESLKSMATEGSRAYKALEVAQTALNLATAIGAIVNQGLGDPYTAFPRILAMAALMSQLVDGINGLSASGPSAQSAEQRQATQGTGSVLGDADAKSESIANAVEITADATTQLVGLNRGMLTALQALQSALGAAGNQLARGAGNVDFGAVGGTSYGLLGPLGAINPLLDTLTSDPLGSAIGNLLFGGSKKVIDQGIVIAGGTLQSMLDDIVVGAYQTIHKDGGLFGSDKTYDRVTDISDEFGKQFELVISSIADTVRQGALALGLLPEDVEAALQAYQVESIRISLKGLSTEEQQAELEAVFSQLFDGLAASVVPFIGQFQTVGEGLGETLVRVATEVQVTQAAFDQLGIAVDETDPERVAQMADALVSAAGGIDDFINGLNAFVSKFAGEDQQFKIVSDSLASALSQVGLTVPTTRDGMWELMQSLDATTEAGRAQIATLLRLADTADAYYDGLDAQAEKLAKASDLLDSLGLGSGLSDFGKELQSITDSEAQAIDAANQLAQAQGREGASAYEVAQIHDWASKQMAAAFRRLQVETTDIIAKLTGGVPASLDAINARIAELESAAGSTSSSYSDAVSTISEAQQASALLFESWKSGIQSVQQYLDSMLLGDLSALSPEEQLAEAKRQLLDVQAAALGGDADALAQLPQMADAFLRLSRDFNASGADYGADFDWVRQLLGSVTNLENPGTEATDTGSGSTSTPIAVAVSASPELQALYAARDEALAAQEDEYRAQLAQQLAQNLHDLAYLTRTPILDMIELQGYALDQLAADMGVDLNNLTGASVLALGNMATTLGLSLTDLTDALGISLTDLSGGLTELTTRLGIDLSNLTVSSTETLAGLANSLGGDLGDLARSLGVDLGDLTDRQSLLNQALADTIDSLAPETRDQLQPLLEAISDATTEADANTAIANLEDAVNAIGGDAATALAPYLSGVFPPDAMSNLDYLSDIQAVGEDQLEVLRDIARGLDVPGYAVGTGYVPSTGLALLHQGEAVLPSPVASWMRSNGFPVAQVAGTPAANDTVVVELRAVRAEIAELRAENTRVTRESTDAIRDEGTRSRRTAEDLQRRNESTNRRANG